MPHIMLKVAYMVPFGALYNNNNQPIQKFNYDYLIFSKQGFLVIKNLPNI